MKQMKLIIISAVLLVMTISMASATISDFGTFKQGQDINLIQICASCSYNNITAILYPNSSVAVSHIAMTNDGGIYNYTLSNAYTNTLGKYLVNGLGDVGGIDTDWNYEFTITKSGDNYINFDFLPLILSLLGVIIILLILAFILHSDHGILALLFAGLGFYMLIPLLNVSNIVIENNIMNTGISDMVGTITTILTWMDYVLIVYIIVYIFVKVISGYNQDKQAKIEGLR